MVRQVDQGRLHFLHMNHLFTHQATNRRYKVGGFEKGGDLNPKELTRDAIPELPDSAIIEQIAPWEEEERQAELQAITDRQAKEAAAAQKREVAIVEQELAAIETRRTESHSEKQERVRAAQAADMRKREVRLQNELSQVPWYKFGERKRLQSTLRIVTDRLNGLTQSTPEMRQFTRKVAVAEAVAEKVPGRQSQPTIEGRSAVDQAQEEMRAAAKQENRTGLFGRLFKTRRYREARANTMGATTRYAKALRERAGRAEVSEAEVIQINKELDRRDQTQERGAA